jgi:hypothetical protein
MIPEDAYAATRLARERRHQRLVRHTRAWLRYERRHGRKHLKHANSCGNQNAVHPRGAYDGVEACGCRLRCGLSGTRPTMVRKKLNLKPTDRAFDNAWSKALLDGVAVFSTD